MKKVVRSFVQLRMTSPSKNSGTSRAKTVNRTEAVMIQPIKLIDEQIAMMIDMVPVKMFHPLMLLFFVYCTLCCFTSLVRFCGVTGTPLIFRLSSGVLAGGIQSPSTK